MKKIVIISALFFVSNILVKAQEEAPKEDESKNEVVVENEFKPNVGDWGFSLNISGIINDIKVENNQDLSGNYFIIAKHILKNEKVLRIGLGINYSKQNFLTEDSISIASGNRALQEVDSSITRFDFALGLGLEKHFGENKRLDPFVGGDLIIGRIGSTNTNATTKITDITGTGKEQLIKKLDGGFYFGIGGLAGFDYFFSKNLSLGVEFGYEFVYEVTGGDYSVSDVITPVSGSQTSTFENGKEQESKINLGATPTGGIVLSFYF